MSEISSSHRQGDVKSSTGKLYHERQRLQLCLLHTLNSLMQKQEYKKNDLDRISESLHSSYWFNRHRSFWGTGNYDVNVLMAALELKGFRVIWFDARRSAASIDVNKVVGFVFNAPCRSFVPFWDSRHWFTVRQIGDSGFFNFDSKLSEPVSIKNFVEFANGLLSNGHQMMIVVLPENAESCFSRFN